MSDAIFIANQASGHLAIGGKKEIDKAMWRKPRGIRLTPTSRYIRDKLFPSEANYLRVWHFSEVMVPMRDVRGWRKTGSGQR